MDKAVERKWCFAPIQFTLQQQVARNTDSNEYCAFVFYCFDKAVSNAMHRNYAFASYLHHVRISVIGNVCCKQRC